MQIVAAAVTVDVQHLTGGVQSRHQAALEGFGVKLGGTDTACRDLRSVNSSSTLTTGRCEVPWRLPRSSTERRGDRMPQGPSVPLARIPQDRAAQTVCGAPRPTVFSGGQLRHGAKPPARSSSSIFRCGKLGKQVNVGSVRGPFFRGRSGSESAQNTAGPLTTEVSVKLNFNPGWHATASRVPAEPGKSVIGPGRPFKP